MISSPVISLAENAVLSAVLLGGKAINYAAGQLCSVISGGRLTESPASVSKAHARPDIREHDRINFSVTHHCAVRD